MPDPDHHPFRTIADPEGLVAAVREIRPAILHSHYLVFTELLTAVAEATGTPFTVRSHSFDTIVTADAVPQHLREAGTCLRSELCLAVLCFPFVRDTLASAGVPAEKLVAAPPVVDFDLFYDASPNTGGVMNVGAGIPKKKMEDFIELGRRVPEMPFDLYAIGHEWARLVDLNERSGRPIRIHEPLPFHEMPRRYKEHRWLAYTACPLTKTVG